MSPPEILIGLIILGGGIFTFFAYRKWVNDAISNRRAREQEYFDRIAEQASAIQKNASIKRGSGGFEDKFSNAGFSTSAPYGAPYGDSSEFKGTFKEGVPFSEERTPLTGVIEDAQFSPLTTQAISSQVVAAQAGEGIFSGIRTLPCAWVTNAPENWPDVDFSMANRTLRCVNSSFYNAKLLDTFICAGCVEGESILTLQTKLTNLGVLEIPLQVFTDGVFRSVFIYPEADLEDAAHFSGVRDLFKELGEVEPVFYAGKVLPLSPPASVCRPLKPQDLSVYRGVVPAGDYGIWWDTSQQDDSAINILRETYTLMDRIESYIAGLLVSELGLSANQGSRRIALPEKNFQVPLLAYHGAIVLMTLSAAKGIRFHFNMAHTTPFYRDCFLAAFRDFIKLYRNQIERDKAPLDHATSNSPLAWWSSMEEAYREDSKNMVIGKISL